jgi:hypothetical protein
MKTLQNEVVAEVRIWWHDFRNIFFFKLKLSKKRFFTKDGLLNKEILGAMFCHLAVLM